MTNRGEYLFRGLIKKTGMKNFRFYLTLMVLTICVLTGEVKRTQ